MRRTNYVIALFFLLLFAGDAYATHNRAGEITFEYIGQSPQQLLYRITIITYTKTSSFQADRPTLDSVYFGDIPAGSPGAFEQFVRQSKVDLPGDISRNTYVKEHTYGGPGTYIIRFTDPNRNADVVNIPFPLSEPFYVESELIISAQLGNNNSPVMTYPPVDQGCVGRVFIHNPGAHDPDPNDSLSYELVPCGGTGGLPIPGYTFPSASNSFSLNAVTGDLIWDSPQAVGEYNVAVNIKQWRKSGNSFYYFGQVRRDLQITIKSCNNDPPEIAAINDTCILAGDTLSFLVTAIDPNQDNVILSASGGPMDGNLVGNPATFTDSIVNNDTVISRFSWATDCSQVRPQPYYVQFKAADVQPAGFPSLVDLEGVFIRIIAPGPPAAEAIADGSNIDLHWTPPPCGNIVNYRIYRRSGMFSGVIPCPCENGVPAYAGYTLIDSNNGDDTTYTDNNYGQGLTIGIEYCYLITAVYFDSSESCASPQVCASLKKDAPGITHADIRTTDPVNGSVFVGWSKPTELDTVQFPGPYEYRVYRSPGFFGSNFNTLVATLNNLNDTSAIDTLLDTKTQPWSYKIELWYTDPSDMTLKLKGQTAVASTIFLRITPTDNRLDLSWEEHVPWMNMRYDIFRQNASLQFDSIASVSGSMYADTGLANGQTYCYFIRSSGSYSFSGFIDPIINHSQIECSVPVDNVNPCSPDLEVLSDCDNNLNLLLWSNPNNTCADDVLKYHIYFSQTETGGYELIAIIDSVNDTSYTHTDLAVLSGCYKVAAVDSVGNETLIPEVFCIDTCRQYVLPSVFTPNGDGANDLFHPCDSTTTTQLQEKNCPPYKNVKSVEMKIFNRWGNLVFETTDIDINWNGKYKDTNKDCPEGVYFYTCRVVFFSVRPAQAKELRGTIQLIRN